MKTRPQHMAEALIELQAELRERAKPPQRLYGPLEDLEALCKAAGTEIGAPDCAYELELVHIEDVGDVWSLVRKR